MKREGLISMRTCIKNETFCVITCIFVGRVGVLGGICPIGKNIRPGENEELTTLEKYHMQLHYRD